MKLVDPALSRVQADPDEMQRALALMTEGIFEIRIPKAGRHRTVRGYFNDHAAAIRATQAWNGQAPALYLTLNPVHPALLARASNRLETYAETTTSDTDIMSRRWLLVDLDPKRPSGISSSEPEHIAALTRAHEVRDWLTTQGWPPPILADSGNGAHLLYRIDLAHDPENTAVIQRVLQALAARFDSAAVTVDTGVFNASRISKLYGTWACKGDSTPDRPHRVSRMLSIPPELECVSLEHLEELARELPSDPPKNRSSLTRPLSRSGDFFSTVNQCAMDQLTSWVPRLFPDAKPYRAGFRVTSHHLNRDREEDIGIQPDGIKDFGLADQGDAQGGKRTPIDLVLEWGQASDAKEAALWLCDQLGLSPDQLGWRKPQTPPDHSPPTWEIPPLESYDTDSRNAPPPAPPLPEPPLNEFIPLARFISGPPTHSYLIKRILPARGLGQVFGSSNVGKSFLLIDLAMHIALGRPWCGFKTQRACVLYIAAEGLSGLAGRMKAWTQRYGFVPDRLYVRPYSVQLTVPGAALALADRIQSLPEPPRLVILDTLAANFGPGDENSAQDMARAMEGLRVLSGDWLGLCAHHSGHGDKTRSRGHSSLYAALDLEMQVSRDDPLGPIKVAHTKCRDMERMDPLFFNLELEALPWADEDGEPINSAIMVPAEGYEEPEKGTALSGKQAQALDLLKTMVAERQSNVGPGGTPRVLIREWYAAMTFEPTAPHRARLRKALEDKRFITVENGFVYVC